MNIIPFFLMLNTVLTSLFGIPAAVGDAPPADPPAVSAEYIAEMSNGTPAEILAPAPELPETAGSAETVSGEHESIPENGYIYLTFDDGPGKYTEEILSVLDEYGVKATFFIVGQFADYYPERVRAIYEGGHAIGCHSATHDYHAVYKDADSIGSDIEAWEKTVSEALGFVPCERLYRYPGGSNCSALPEQRFAELHAEVSARGYRAFDWNCANNDKWLAGKEADQELGDYFKESVKSSLKLCRGEKIMLLHETVFETAEMLPWLIEYLKGEGYGFALLSDFDGEYLFAAHS